MNILFFIGLIRRDMIVLLLHIFILFYHIMGNMW